jgi:hypothetical protein
MFAASCLFGASIANATPVPAIAGHGLICSAPARGVMAHIATLVSEPQWAESVDPNAVVRRGHADRDTDDDAAVQDDAPAVRFDADDGLAPPLEPAGTPANSRDAVTNHRTFSPRSPRGPPVFH